MLLPIIWYPQHVPFLNHYTEDIADDFHGNGIRLLDLESFDFECNLHQNYLLPVKCEGESRSHTAFSLDLGQYLLSCNLWSSSGYSNCCSYWYQFKGFRAYKLGHQATGTSSIFSLSKLIQRLIPQKHLQYPQRKAQLLLHFEFFSAAWKSFN